MFFKWPHLVYLNAENNAIYSYEWIFIIELLLFSACFDFFWVLINSLWKLDKKEKIARGPPTANLFFFFFSYSLFFFFFFTDSKTWTLQSLGCCSIRRKHIHPPMPLPLNYLPPSHSSACQGMGLWNSLHISFLPLFSTPFRFLKARNLPQLTFFSSK